MTTQEQIDGINAHISALCIEMNQNPNFAIAEQLQQKVISLKMEITRLQALPASEVPADAMSRFAALNAQIKTAEAQVQGALDATVQGGNRQAPVNKDAVYRQITRLKLEKQQLLSRYPALVGSDGTNAGGVSQ